MTDYEKLMAEAAKEAATEQYSYGNILLGKVVTGLTVRVGEFFRKERVQNTVISGLVAALGAIPLYVYGDAFVKLHNTIQSDTTFPGMPGSYVGDIVNGGAPQPLPTEAGVRTLTPEVAVN